MRSALKSEMSTACKVFWGQKLWFLFVWGFFLSGCILSDLRLSLKAHTVSDKHQSKCRSDNMLGTGKQTVRPVQAALKQPNYSQCASVNGSMCHCPISKKWVWKYTLPKTSISSSEGVGRDLATLLRYLNCNPNFWNWRDAQVSLLLRDKQDIIFLNN